MLFSDLGLPIDTKVIAECVEVRRIIEVQAIALACERRTDADLDRLQRTLGSFRDDEAFSDFASEYDYEFHINLFRAAGNDVLIRLVTPFYIMSRQRRLVFFADQQRRRVSHEQHLELMEAITGRDKRAAQRFMSNHIGRVEKYFSQ